MVCFVRLGNRRSEEVITLLKGHRESSEPRGQPCYQVGCIQPKAEVANRTGG